MQIKDSANSKVMNEHGWLKGYAKVDWQKITTEDVNCVDDSEILELEEVLRSK